MKNNKEIRKKYKNNEILILEQDDDWLRKIHKINKESNIFDFSSLFFQSLLNTNSANS